MALVTLEGAHDGTATSAAKSEPRLNIDKLAGLPLNNHHHDYEGAEHPSSAFPTPVSSFTTPEQPPTFAGNDYRLRAPDPGSLEADKAFCGTYPCRVVVPGWIGEQETRAQQHFIQLGLLVSALNEALRATTPEASGDIPEAVGPFVLVLPNVSKSRIGTCFKHPFESYYKASSDVLKALGIGRTVTFEAFQNWVETRDVRPKAQMVMIEHNARDAASSNPDVTIQEIRTTRHRSSRISFPAEIVHDRAPEPDTGKHDHCLSEKAERLVFSRRRPQLTVFPPSRPKLWHKSEEAVDAMRLAVLEALGVRREGPQQYRGPLAPDVFVLNWELRWPLFDSTWIGAHAQEDEIVSQGQETVGWPLQYLSHNSKWAGLADVVAEKLSPYLAVHWRMETAPVEPLERCANGLVAKLQSILLEKSNADVRTVYFATYFPLEGLGSPHEGTWKDGQVHEEHRKAIHALLAAFAEGLLEGWTLTNLREVWTAHELGQGELDGMDSGILAIMDKTIAMRAELFVSGTDTCSRRSSFTQQIVEGRAENRMARNVVDLFDTAT